uniref:Fibronectin type-III domain-containing protein n=1 Tax=Phytophthora fragariae TaxID=53985 RepID=A0A6A3FWB6_9STRA|nr:hypothetical protein PF009_g1735 [Phytophthora fragariae]
MLHDKRLGGGANQWRGMLLLLLWCLLCCCDVPALAMEQAESSTQILSRAGCACQPTLFSATNSAVTCYQTNSSSPLGCAVDPSDPCADGVLDRTWDLCNVVDLHLVTDRISSTTTTGGSLNATLYGKDRVTLKRAQLSDFILQHKVSKVTLALDNDTAVESVKIEATASMSLRIYEVQTTVNNLPTTIFSPPSPGPISFVSSEETSSTGVVSLLFVPVTEYFNSDVLSQCYFDLVGRCGYHADLQNSFDLFFLAEDNNEPIVAAKSSASPSFRRLSEQEKPRAPTPRPLSFLPKLALNYSDVPEGAHVDITVAVGAVNNIDYIEDLDVELLTIREVEVEWVPKSETDQPTSSGEAVYRSLPTRLQGNSTLSFKYQMGSDFSSISTDVVLNSSETRTVWSSESAVIVQDRWNYVEALIDLTYPSTAEIIFRGIASAEDTLRLTEISIRDFIQEMIVGAIDFVRATGGMIYVEISTAKSVPEPVLLRAYVNRLNSSKSPALSFTGSDLQYVGCEAITNMYACGDGSGIHFDSPTQCRSVCSAVETQLKFTPDSIVRSAQMMAFPVVDSFTIEFWAYFESLSTSSSNEQLLLLFGTQEGSLGITLSSSITISRCENQLRIPHGIPLREWTHVAIVFGTNDEVALFIDGSPVADGLLSKNNCDVPSFAYLQLGRDTMDILPDTSVLFGAMDEIRIWKLRHNTVYIFRIRIISKIGAQSAFSIPVSARTRDRASPSKTPQPVVADVTGGSITLVLKEPLDTGGLAIAQYNIFILQNDSFLKWTNAVASSASENTTISVTRDIEGAPLLPETSYTLKVLALQVDVSCDTLAEDGLESDEVTIITEKAAIPAPPPIPVLLQLSGCTALVTATPPDDFGGAGATGMTIGVFMSTGILRESFAVTLDPGVITVRNLLAHTRFLVKASLSTTIGSTEFGEALAFTTEDPSLPGKLAQLSYTNVGPSSVQVQWEEPENTGGGIISGYLIYERVIEANATRKLVYNSSDDSSTTSFLVGDLLAETLYIFSVLPVNQYGILGMDSENVVSITTSAAEAPSSPTNLEQSQVDGGYFDVSFSEPSETVVPQQPPPPELISATGGALYVTVVAPTDCGGSDLSSYVLNIARRTGGSLVYRQYASGPIQSSPYDKQLVNVSIYGLLSKSEYFITVSVENGQGWSQQSDGKAYSTSGPTPVRGMNPPKVALEDPGEITLAWDTPLDSGGLSIVGYMVQARYQLADGSWSPSKIVYDDRSSLVQTALITNIRPNTQYGFSVTAYNFRTQPLRSYLVNGSVEGAELQSLATSREKVD